MAALRVSASVLKASFASFLLLCLTSKGLGFSYKDCTTTTHKHTILGDNCFVALLTPGGSNYKSFADGKTYCREQGGQLAVILTQDEFTAITTDISTVSPHSGTWLWLALTQPDPASPDDQGYFWTERDGSTVAFTSGSPEWAWWNPGEPNDSDYADPENVVGLRDSAMHDLREDATDVVPLCQFKKCLDYNGLDGVKVTTADVTTTASSVIECGEKCTEESTMATACESFSFDGSNCLLSTKNANTDAGSFEGAAAYKTYFRP